MIFRSLAKLFLVLILVSIAGFQLSAQTTAPSKYQPTVIIDSQALSEERRAAILASLSKLTNVSSWSEVTVAPHDSLSKLIYDYYGYSESKFPKTTDALIKIISEANNLQNKLVFAGRQMRIPLLPARPYAKGARADLAQVIDTQSDSMFIAKARDVVARANETANDQTELARGSTWIVRMSPQENLQFLADLPLELRTSLEDGNIYSGPTVEVEEVSVSEPPDFENEASTAAAANPAQLNFVTGLNPASVGKYYVLDFFKPKNSSVCTHGDMVVDVAKQTLDKYGAGQLKGNIIPLQIDFFEDKDAASQIILDYIKTFSSDKIQNNLKAAVDKLRSQSKPTPEKRYVPLLYLQALYNNLISRPDTAVVSSSFFLRFDGFHVVPLNYRPESGVNLLSAVMDDGGHIEEALVEPQKSFYEGRRDLGVILVGAEKDAGHAFGMTSRNGDGVSCIAQGTGWGTTESCITPAKIGTSFSTPAIAVQMLLAKAYWSANGLNFSGKEAKTRLLLSSDVTPAFVGQYASGGLTRLEKLLRPNGAFAEKTDGTITDLLITGGFIEVNSPSGGSPDRFNFKRGSEGFCGIQIVEGRTFIFREAVMQWKEVDPVNFSLTIRKDGIDETLSLTTFATQFKEAVIL